jgi:hypothetical protein
MERRRSARRPQKKLKVPSLRMGFNGAVTEDACGGFRRRRQWTVDNPERGLIVQHVTRAFTGVRQWMPGTTSWAAMNDAQIDVYVTGEEPYATIAEYWEAWQVNDKGRVTANEDSFALCSIVPDGQHVINTTRGTFTITGVAQFYQTDLTPTALGFTGAVGPAGVIANRDDDPTTDLATNGATASGEVVGYEIVATWNSRHTGVIPIGFGADGSGTPPYFPDTVYTTVVESAV